MTAQKIILDTGPLVAFLNKKDRHHEWTKAQFSTMSPPLLTCEAVLSEACYLVRNFKNGVVNALKLLERDLISIPFRLQDELSAIKLLLNKYQDLQMSLADGCLVRMSEQISDSAIFTLDRDFEIYRKDKRKVIPVIMPSW